MRLAKPTACSRRVTTIPASAMKVAISPTVIRFLRNNKAPKAMIDRIASVVDARVSTVATAHHDSTGYCAASKRSPTDLSATTSDSIRTKLCTNAMLPSASDALSARSE
jgi:hypothetical protein